jgi:hypothetical protein
MAVQFWVVELVVVPQAVSEFWTQDALSLLK